MNYAYKYKTPKEFSDLILFSNDNCLTGLMFDGGKNFQESFLVFEYRKVEAFDETIKWLDIYFKGKDPGFIPKFELDFKSDCRKYVYNYLLNVPFGESVTYGEIAKSYEKDCGKKISAQGIGRVVGPNPISLIIPCHRVLGKNGSITGYNGCMKNKAYLMLLENIEKGKQSAFDYIEYQKHKIYKD